MRARGRRPSALARSSDIQSTAAAPSEICDELPGGVDAVGQHRLQRWPAPRSSCPGGPGPRRSTGAPPCARPRAFLADDRGLDRGDLAGEPVLGRRPRAAFCCETSPSQSMSSRVMPYFSAIRSAATNWSAGRTAGPPGWPGRRPAAVLGPERHPAHRLDAAADPDVDGAGRDQVGDEVVRLLRRPALAVDRRARHLVRQALEEPRRPRHVEALLAGLGDAPRRRPARPSPGRCRPA